VPRLTASATQYALIGALFAFLLGGLLLPGGSAQALGLAGTPGRDVPLASGTPGTVRPAPPLPATPPGAVGTPGAAPLAALPSASAATPQADSPTGGTPTLSLPATMPRVPTATPTRLPSGHVSAAILRGLAPLAFTLTGRTQVAQTTLAVMVEDTAPSARQPGWSLSLTVEQFQVAGFPARVLPTDAVAILGVTVACVRAADCTAPQNTIAYPLAIPAGRATTIYTAAPGSGSGQFVVTPTFAITVPGNASIGSYSTTIVPGIASDRSTSPAAPGIPPAQPSHTAVAATTPPRATPAASPSPAPSLAPPAVTATAAATASVPSLAPLAPTATAAVTPPPPSLAPLSPSKTATVAVPAPTTAPSTPMPPTATAIEVASAPVPPSPAPFAATDRIGTSLAVNLRTGPSASYPTQGLLPSGTPLLATGETRMVAGGLWRQFALADGRTGWVRDLDVLSVSR